MSDFNADTTPQAEDQEAMLLRKICLLIHGAQGSGRLSETARTIAASAHTADFDIAAGHRSIGLIFSADFSGTVAGLAFAGPADTLLEFNAPSGDTLSALAVTVSAGTVRVLTIG